jgi:hypothetical protein
MHTQEHPWITNGRAAVNLGEWITRCVAVTVEVFLHSGFGARYLGIQAVLALPLMVLYCGFWKGHDVRPMLYLIEAYLVVLVLHWLGAGIRRARGIKVHSRYSGWPSLMSKKAVHKEVTFKRFVEPFLLGASGVLLTDWNKPFGTYLLLAALCLYWANSIDADRDAQQAMDVDDAMIEQQMRAWQMRRGMGRF